MRPKASAAAVRTAALASVDARSSSSFAKGLAIFFRRAIAPSRFDSSVDS